MKKKNVSGGFSIVPIHTLERLIGKDGWTRLILWIKKKHPKTKTVFPGYTAKGIVLYQNGIAGKFLGRLADLMVRAKVQSQPEPEFTPHVGKNDKRVSTRLKIFKPDADPVGLEQTLLKKGLKGHGDVPLRSSRRSAKETRKGKCP